MQVRNPVVCDASKGSLLFAINHPWGGGEGQHAFQLAEFVGWSAHVTFGGSRGMVSTARYTSVYLPMYFPGHISG